MVFSSHSSFQTACTCPFVPYPKLGVGRGILISRFEDIHQKPRVSRCDYEYSRQARSRSKCNDVLRKGHKCYLCESKASERRNHTEKAGECQLQDLDCDAPKGSMLMPNQERERRGANFCGFLQYEYLSFELWNLHLQASVNPPPYAPLVRSMKVLPLDPNYLRRMHARTSHQETVVYL